MRESFGDGYQKNPMRKEFLREKCVQFYDKLKASLTVFSGEYY